MTALQDLVTSLGAVYLQDPLDPAGYVLAGSAVTSITNLIDSAAIAKGGSDTIILENMCTQPTFTYNPQPASGSGNPHIRRTAYTSVTGCLQASWTLLFTSDNQSTVLYSWNGTTISSTDSIVHVIVVDAGATLTLRAERQWGDGSGNQVRQVTGISKTHHVFGLKVNDATWQMFVDGVSVGSGTWVAGTWNTTTSVFQSGAPSIGPDSSSLEHHIGQMVLFPSILGSGDYADVSDAMEYIMCNGHPVPRFNAPPHIGEP